MLSTLASFVLPVWARWAAIAAAMAATYFLGDLHGTRVTGQIHTDYVLKQAAETTRIAQAQTKVVVKTEIEYRDRIQKIYVQGETNEKVIHDLVVPADDARFHVNVGFVRAYNAAWSGDAPGPATDADREPAAVPVSDIAEVDNANATSCRIWREQALGWRVFYRDQQTLIDGAPPAWYKEP